MRPYHISLLFIERVPVIWLKKRISLVKLFSSEADNIQKWCFMLHKIQAWYNMNFCFLFLKINIMKNLLKNRVDVWIARSFYFVVRIRPRNSLNKYLSEFWYEHFCYVTLINTGIIPVPLAGIYFIISNQLIDINTNTWCKTAFINSS